MPTATPYRLPVTPLVGLIALACLMLVGCHTPLTLANPAATVASVRVTETTADAARVEVTVLLENPNADVHLPLPFADYTLSVEGAGSLAMRDRTNRALPAGGNQTLVLAGSFPTDGTGLAGRAYRVTGSVTYEPPGEIRRLMTENYIPLPWTSFSDRGTLE